MTKPPTRNRSTNVARDLLPSNRSCVVKMWFGFSAPGQCQLFAGVEGEREGNAWFCGEHTSLDAHGYLEGAVETGERAASQVATAIG